MKLTLACFLLIWSVQAEVGNSLKCWRCTSIKNNATAVNEALEMGRNICPENFENTTLLTECNRPGDNQKSPYCTKAGIDGSGRSMHDCGQGIFEELAEDEVFQKKPKMNGECVTSTSKDGTMTETNCFCNSDGCNPSGATQLSFILFFVAFFSRFAF